MTRKSLSKIEQPNNKPSESKSPKKGMVSLAIDLKELDNDPYYEKANFAAKNQGMIK